MSVHAGQGPCGSRLIAIGQPGVQHNMYSTEDKAHSRYRQVVLPDFPKHLFTVKFILGTPAYPEKPISSEGVERSKFMREIQAEMKQHGDMVMLDVCGPL